MSGPKKRRVPFSQVPIDDKLEAVAHGTFCAELVGIEAHIAANSAIEKAEQAIGLAQEAQDESATNSAEIAELRAQLLALSDRCPE